ncbi:MAG: hypothetical protein UU73_C0001G0240 [Candidatus Daviesbacteria bacterium GW2011_GWA1_41_61]|uniref:Uncharacterized protein n=1 Tax=Candidatus Daviesbacteria bacterium GW2011_GWA2_40_9 TaxID=1618424 RepID=A0A0G0TZP5_9BACT|nr:MAG: hypothetical protein UU26_C0007G0022 [Candidatus Daviesbacteria bacterium GW2011_GWC1_40_9]KKR82308.1 MAG: hypothetical protein UU29_C0016G0019 [Candidatus Daviesbacteria bacterium GW2011_GWA2_40_9]KKR93059.1 MAG: hypothetical protein UU44_C0004G0241 [Candidatus Daviesbacteria bacterium GW2011_GWB1_41_15]KKS15603.1 MAG: hypothetical protein UU73_C0001G0240 [Candidatus Daviesbacteria bacterium GW2011_GWA1_41_61]
MAIESKDKILEYPEVLDKLAAKSAAPFQHPQLLIDRYLRVLGLSHELFRIQEGLGFYPLNLSHESLNKAGQKDGKLLSPYTLVRWRRVGWPFPGEKLQGVDYFEDSATRKIVESMVERMGDAIEYANRERLLGARLIEHTIKPQIYAWETGQFEKAMFEHINMRNLSNPVLLASLFDRYIDPWGIKYASQGWVLNRDDALTGYYNLILKTSLKGTREEEKHRVVVGEAAAFSGLPVRRGGWSGNTLPSEDNLRREIGSTSYVFYNVLIQKFENLIKPNLLKYIPEVTQFNKWEYKARKAAIIDLILHEGYGHSQVPFDETMSDALQGDYVSIKEFASEILTHMAALGLPAKLVDPEVKKILISVSLAWLRADYENYLAETNESRKKPNEAYARAYRFVEGLYLKGGNIRVNADNGTIEVGDLDDISSSAREFVEGLKRAVNLEKTKTNTVRDFVRQYTGDPDNCLAQAS